MVREAVRALIQPETVWCAMRATFLSCLEIFEKCSMIDDATLPT
jgi:hypothetical protein